MNLKEIDNLINSLDKNLDKELIRFYKNKRKILVKEISKNITNIINTKE